MAKLQRALSVSDLLNKKYKVLPLSPKWHDAFDEPESTGVWFVWANSGNGKTTFVLELCKELCRFGRVAYNSLEEGSAKTMQDAYKRVGMATAKKKLLLLNESMEDLDTRLSLPKSPEFIVIDSFQYAQMSFAQYLLFKRKHKNKLIVIISQAEGKQPSGRAAKAVMYDAALKIWVEGHRAYSKGRYIGAKGTYDIWRDGVSIYHGDNN